MTLQGSAPQGSVYLSSEQLYIGAFIMLDLPWFKHSFTRNNFKILDQAQIKELRALQLPRYKYDPLRSDPAPESQPVPEPGPNTDAAPPPPQATEPVAGGGIRRVRQEQVLQRRENVEQVERAFAKATTVVKSMNKNVFSRPKETLEDLTGLVGDMVDAFLLSPEATLHVMGEKAGGEDVYFHSLNVSILAMMLAKETGLRADLAREMCMGALLHDIGLIEIPDRVVKKPSAEATKAERNFRATHVDLGVTIGKRLGLPPQALAVVAQHHEFADGSGYPNGIKLEQMAPGARLVSLINFYDNLCNPADISKALTPHEALSYMFAHCRAKFDPRALQMLIRSLGVHPPGSIVQLSNGTFAMVTSINPKKPLRPCVLIYDEAVPKDEAMTVDLEEESELQILKSIRPSLLSPKVAAYLNPRKRVTYFFDGSNTTPVVTSS